MTKTEFENGLRSRLKSLPKEDIERSLDFYREMIDDKVEAGIGEEEAVFGLGSLDDIAENIMLDMPLNKIIKTKYKRTSPWKIWEIIAIVLGSPIWLSFAAAVVAIIICIYAVVWSVAASVWVIFASVFAIALAGVVVGIITAASGALTTSLVYFGMALVFAGLSIFCFYGGILAVKLSVKLCVLIIKAIKRLFIKKGEEQ